MFAVILIFSSIVSTLFSCSEKDLPVSSRTFEFKTYAFGENGSHQLVLNNMQGQIVKIESDATWLTATEGESTADGCPVIIVCNKEGSNKEAHITVKTNNGDEAFITVIHTSFVHNELNAFLDKFVTNWWEFDTIPLQGISTGQRAPWTIEGGVTIPSEVRRQYKPEQGWEMAFTYLNDDTMEGVRFFSLYNKWTGQMRVYTYIQNPSGWGNDINFLTYFGEYNSSVMYPLYNTFQYGIPTCHKLDSSLQRNAKIVGHQPQTFSTWISPYRENASLSPGWYVFEFDMSGYVPDGVDWLNSGYDGEAKFKFFAETTSQQSVTLKGSLIGKLDGTFQNEKIVQKGGTSALYGISSALGMLSGMASSSITGANTYATLMGKNGGKDGIGAWLNPIRYWGGFACSIGSGLLSFFAEQTDPVSYDTIPGKIDLALNATVDLEGYITSYTSNDFKPLGVSRAAINSANRQGDQEGHVGKGVWGLDQDPVVYIDKEVLMSTEPVINIVNRGNGTYSQPGDFKSNAVRLVWLFDPTSVKVNLNRQLFPGEVKDLSVTTTCGIYTDREVGNTDPYRKMLMLPDRPSFDMSSGTSKGELLVLSKNSNPRLEVVPLTALLDTDPDAYETANNSTFIDQPGAGGMHFYGRVVNECGKDIMIDPQIYVPFTKDNTTYISNPKAPDFVVTVNVVFEWNDNAFLYTKCFIPRIEVVDHATMLSIYDSLKTYADKCAAQEPTGKLANDATVDVYHPGGDKLLTKAFRMMEKIK
jgi:hypothetical protein